MKDNLGGYTIRQNNLNALATRVAVPRYDRDKVTVGIAHFGVGGFHRSHQAVYTDAVLQAGDGRWGICGIGIKPQDRKMYQALAPQNFLYTVVSRSEERERAGIIGSILDYRLAEDSREDVFRILTQPAVEVVSLTVTENGYHFCGDSGGLDLEDIDIKWDMEHPKEPKTVIGFLVETLRRGEKEKIKPPTIMSCDNIPHNGEKLRNAVLTFSRFVDVDLAAYIEQEVSFVSTMVDRITPVTGDEQRAYLKEKYGIIDNWPVFCEDFTQWIIEDKFTKGHPDWSALGAQFVSDVVPYETMKIRLLNGSHSALSYIAYLLGYREVDKAMKNLLVSEFVRNYMDEILPTVGRVPGIDLREYTEKLRERFANRAVSDQIVRLAQDGSRKIPNGIVEPLLEILRKGWDHDYIAFAFAAWIRFIGGKDEEGREIIIDDPLKEDLHAAAGQCGENVLPFFSLRKIFPPEVSAHKRFLDDVFRYLERLREKGAQESLRVFLNRERNEVSPRRSIC